MNYPHIKLYSKELIAFKSKDMQDVNRHREIIFSNYICTSMQEFNCRIIEILDKKNKYKVEITFYTIETLKEMIDDIYNEYINSNKM